MMAPYVIARTSMPCAFVNVNNSTRRPSASSPNGARETRSRCMVHPEARMSSALMLKERSKGCMLSQHEDDRGIDGIAPEPRAVNLQSTGKCLVRFEWDDVLRVPGRRDQRLWP